MTPKCDRCRSCGCNSDICFKPRLWAQDASHKLTAMDEFSCSFPATRRSLRWKENRLCAPLRRSDDRQALFESWIINTTERTIARSPPATQRRFSALVTGRHALSILSDATANNSSTSMDGHRPDRAHHQS